MRQDRLTVLCLDSSTTVRCELGLTWRGPVLQCVVIRDLFWQEFATSLLLENTVPYGPDQLHLLLLCLFASLQIRFHFIVGHFAISPFKLYLLGLLLGLQTFREEVSPSFIMILMSVVTIESMEDFIDRARVLLVRLFEFEGHVALWQRHSVRSRLIRPLLQRLLPGLLAMQLLFMYFLLGNCCSIRCQLNARHFLFFLSILLFFIFNTDR